MQECVVLFDVSLSSLKPLGHRNFALLWSAALVSNIGSWVQAVALGIFVTNVTHNPFWTGLVAAAAFLPNGLLAPFGGVMADRFDRRRWLLLTTAFETIFAGLLAVLSATGSATPGLAVLVAFFGGTASAIGFPAYQAMLPDLVGREDLLAAVSLSSAQFNLGRVIGPVVAGVVIVEGSYSLAFLVNAVSFFAVIVALLLVRLPPREVARVRSGIIAPMISGIHTAWSEPGCRSAVVLIGIVALIGSPFIALVPAIAVTGLHAKSAHQGSAFTSVLVTAQGIGAVVAALVLPSVARRFGRGHQLRTALMALPVLLVLYGLSSDIGLSAASIFFLGAGYIAVLSGLNTVVQLRAPRAERGRVLSLFMLALGTLYPVGSVIEGEAGRLIGARTVTVGAGVALFVAMVFILVARRDYFVAVVEDI